MLIQVSKNEDLYNQCLLKVIIKPVFHFEILWAFFFYESLVWRHMFIFIQLCKIQIRNHPYHVDYFAGILSYFGIAETFIEF